MGSGILQLASYGKQDNEFYKQPTITYFKTMYKKHTNFVSESIPQQFNIKPDFGKRVTCTIGDIGDLMGKVYLNVNLPPIGKFSDIGGESGAGNSQISCCAWGNKIGYRLIKNIEFEINDKVIEKHTFDWFNVYNEISNDMGKRDGLKRIIGDVEELYSFSESKDGYLLSIPLIFWFNKYPDLAFPLISAYNSSVKINIEFNTLENCLLLGPTHYLEIKNDICLFTREDILCQNVNGKLHYFKFIYYDANNKRLYYIKITTEEITSSNEIYALKNTSYSVSPTGKEKLYFNKKKYFNQTINLALGNTYLLVDYIFLDTREKYMFLKNKLTYIISILQFDNPNNIYHSNRKVKINYSYPCTELLFNCSQEYLQSGYMKDVFNYSVDITGKEEIMNSVILYMNGQERLSEQSMKYFNLLQPYAYHKHIAPIGLGSYSFSLNIDSSQPSGYCNFSKMSDMEIQLKLNKNVSYTRPIKFRIYATVLRQLVIENGLCYLE
jgi:hypothetical protein